MIFSSEIVESARYSPARPPFVFLNDLLTQAAITADIADCAGANPQPFSVWIKFADKADERPLVVPAETITDFCSLAPFWRRIINKDRAKPAGAAHDWSYAVEAEYQWRTIRPDLSPEDHKKAADEMFYALMRGNFPDGDSDDDLMAKGVEIGGDSSFRDPARDKEFRLPIARLYSGEYIHQKERDCTRNLFAKMAEKRNWRLVDSHWRR